MTEKITIIEELNTNEKDAVIEGEFWEE